MTLEPTLTLPSTLLKPIYDHRSKSMTHKKIKIVFINKLKVKKFLLTRVEVWQPHKLGVKMVY